MPPFYEGKALFPHEGAVLVSAIPSFSSNSRNNVYTWSENGTVLGDQSGYGKDSVLISQPVIANPINVSVKVTSLDGSVSAQNGLTIPDQSPQVLFYVNDPVYGIAYQTAFTSTFNLGSQQVVLQAEPYFFDSYHPGNDRAVTYDWSINGSEVDPTQNGKNYLILRKSDATGQADISLQATDANKILQFDTADLTMSF